MGSRTPVNKQRCAMQRWTLSSFPCAKVSVWAVLTYPVIAWHFVRAACELKLELDMIKRESCLWAVGGRGD